MALTMKTFGQLVSAISQWTPNILEEAQLIRLERIAKDIAASDVVVPNEQPRVDLVPLFNFIIQGEKISAIKEHRSLTGMGLKESKDEVERLMGTKFPA